jgi:hypothetical protein
MSPGRMGRREPGLAQPRMFGSVNDGRSSALLPVLIQVSDQ